MECRHYARSLINNLSLLSGYVLVPEDSQLDKFCEYLATIRKTHQTDDETLMEHLINGTPELNVDPTYRQLKELVTQIKTKVRRAI
jgi:hypothetical protein